MCVITDAADTQLRPGEDSGMTTLANTLALFGMTLIRFGGRGGGGFAFMLFGLLILGVVVWALVRPYEGPRSNVRPGSSSPAPGAQE
jgi:hypothetical protein